MRAFLNVLLLLAHGRRSRGACFLVAIPSITARLLAGSVSEAPVSFRNDIVPILSKANCNRGI